LFTSGYLRYAESPQHGTLQLLRSKEELSEEPEYLAQLESDNDTDDDLIQIKRRRRTTEKVHDPIEQVTQVSLYDIDQHKEDALFSTPPTTPHPKRATATQPSQSTGESNPDQQPDADLDSFFTDLTQDDYSDLASEEPVSPIRQPTRRSTRFVARPD
jgi:hypothetical protein